MGNEIFVNDLEYADEHAETIECFPTRLRELQFDCHSVTAPSRG